MKRNNSTFLTQNRDQLHRKNVDFYSQNFNKDLVMNDEESVPESRLLRSFDRK